MEIHNIAIEKLFHHPHNRTDMGNLEELTASIIRNGLLQNLTVVKYDHEAHPGLAIDNPESAFVVIVGNRRLDAARAAGLQELPCEIVTLSPFEQIATMMQENVLRKSPTLIEQAESFRTLRNELGLSAEEIANRTGFSIATVYNRLKVADIDHAVLMDAQNKGATMAQCLLMAQLNGHTDYQQLMLRYLNYPSALFISQLESYKKEIAKTERFEKAIQKVSSFATAISAGVHKKKFVCNFKGLDIPLEKIAAPDPDATYYFTSNTYDHLIALYTDWSETELNEKAVHKNKLEQEQAQLDSDYQILEELDHKYEHRRTEFIRSIPEATAKAVRATIVNALTVFFLTYGSNILYGPFPYPNYEQLCDLLSETPFLNEDGKALGVQDWNRIAMSSPDRSLLLYTYSILDRVIKSTALVTGTEQNCFVSHHWGCVVGSLDQTKSVEAAFYNNKAAIPATQMYTLLDATGYIADEEELQLANGTHPLFQHKVQN